MLNHIDLMGRLTKDPELRYTNNDTPVASFTLAVDRDVGNGTDFINCVAWKKTGEFVDKYFQKGSMAAVSGRLQIREWKDSDGKTKYSTEVVVDRAYFGEAKKKDEQKKSGAFSELDDDGPLPL